MPGWLYHPQRINNSDTSNATLNPPPHCSKQVYVILPGHPFYGKKTSLLQVWKTGYVEWGLITHPTQECFKYKILTKWLSDKAPDIIAPFSRKTKIIGIPFYKLQQLATMLNFIIESNSLLKEDDVKFSSGTQNEGSSFEQKLAHSSKKDLGKDSKKTKKSSRRQTRISHTNTDGKGGR